MLYKYHDKMGHFGVEKTVHVIKQNYWFPKLKEKVESHVRNCLKCIAYSPVSGRKEGYLHSIPKGNVPFNTLHIDYYGPVDRARLVKQYVFLIVDAFTKYVKLYPTKHASTSEAIRCLDDYFVNYSRPGVIISDRGASFTSREFCDFVNGNDVKHILIATGSPQANGQVERINRILTPMLAKLVDNENGKYWYKVLRNVEYSLNNTLNKSIGTTPSEALFGISQRGKVRDEIATYLQNNRCESDRNINRLRSNIVKNTELSQKRNESIVNRKRKKPYHYEKGDLIMIRNFDNTAGASRKLIPQFKGPYKIVKCLRHDHYVVADEDGYQNTQRPYRGVWQACNMRPWRNID